MSPSPALCKEEATVDIQNVGRSPDYNESKVLVLYTGGTIGMVRNSEGALSPAKQAMEKKIRKASTMHDEEYSVNRFSHYKEILHGPAGVATNKDDIRTPLVLPHVPNKKRVIYTIYEYDPLLDSSNMTMDDWLMIARDIKDSYELFDGFVVLHGTDTMAYTASALSFMLENLGKPVIVTGSQIPCFETRSDGRDNLVGALILAGNYSIPEVGVYFRHQLMRGNRTIKVSSGSLDAFHSPNMVPLVRAGIDITVDYKAIHKPTSIEKFTVHNKLNPNVVLVRLFPSIRAESLAHFLKPPVEGVVLQCYGSGNIPNNRDDIMKLFKDAHERGVILLSVTQCTHGGVSGIYATGKALLDIGVIPGNDLTPEAALTKLSYVLSKDGLSLEQKRKMMETNLVGEMTILNFKGEPSLQELNGGGGDEPDKDLDIVLAVAQQLKCKTSEEMEGIRDILFPSILCAAVYTGMTAKLEVLRTKYGANMAVSDYDNRTPLHVAASEGNVAVVEYLLKSGASIHLRDRNEDTPLMSAINGCHRDVVRVLVACGAHLQLGLLELGEELCYLARLGKKKRLSCYKLAGANLNTVNMTKKTALHSATETGQTKVVQFLLEHDVDTSKKDAYGLTALDIAKTLKRVEIEKMLLKHSCT